MDFKSFARGVGKFVGGSFLILLISLTVYSYGFTSFSDYNNLKPIFVETISSTAAKETGTNKDLNAADMQAYISQQCSNQSTITMPLGEEGMFGEKEITVSCDKALQAKNPFSVFAEAIFDKFYYKTYSCSVIQCLTEGGDKTLVVVTNQGHEFFKGAIKYLIGGIIFTVLIVIMSSVTIAGALQTVGASSIISGLNYIFMKLAENMVPAEARTNEIAGSAIAKVFSTFETGFLIVLIAGVSLFVIGYIWKKFKKSKPTSEN